MSSKASSGVKAIGELGKVQGECKSLLDDLMASIQVTPGDNVMQRLETAFTKAQSVDTFGSRLASAGSKFGDALSSIFSFFRFVIMSTVSSLVPHFLTQNNYIRSIETLVMKMSAVSWNSLFQSMSKLQAHYPTALQDAKRILTPTGLTAMFLKTSPYLGQIETAVKDVKALINLDDAAAKTKSVSCFIHYCLLCSFC
jgi:hypothetical protein